MPNAERRVPSAESIASSISTAAFAGSKRKRGTGASSISQRRTGSYMSGAGI